VADGSSQQDMSVQFWRLVSWLFNDPPIPGFPWLQLLFYYLVILIFVFVFERLFVRSTLFLVLRASLYRALGIDEKEPSPAKQRLKALADAAAQELPVRAAAMRRQSFWAQVLAWDHGSIRSLESQQQSQLHESAQESISFTHRQFSTVESEDHARIRLRRAGNCLCQVSVRVRSVESRFAGSFQAKAGTDFEQTEEVLNFAPGIRELPFEVPIYRTTAAWSVPTHFEVELVGIVSGQAHLAGPTIAEWGAEDARRLPGSIFCKRTAFPCTFQRTTSAVRSGLHGITSRTAYRFAA